MKVFLLRFLPLLAVSLFQFEEASAQVRNLSPDEFEKAIKSRGAQLVDVRTPEEFGEKHIQGAVNINFNGPDFQKKMAALDKTKPVFIYCLAGGRSKSAADWAAGNGFAEVSNLTYGINAWVQAKKPVVTPGNAPAKSGMTFEQYLERINKSSKLVLVDFNAVWCGPCKILKPRVENVVKRNSTRVELFDIDVDKNPLVAGKMNVRGIPLLIMYRQGKEVWRSTGLVEEADVKAKVDEFAAKK